MDTGFAASKRELVAVDPKNLSIDSIEGGIGNIRSVISLSSAEGLRSSI
jgi:hypothetical protein